MEHNNVHKKTKAGCLCGEVQFEILGELRDIVNCHCSKCRKFHGNYGTYTSVKVENLKITQQKSLKWYKSPREMKLPMCTVVFVQNVDHLFSGTQKINHTSQSLQAH
jgi:hypothetical protein